MRSFLPLLLLTAVFAKSPEEEIVNLIEKVKRTPPDERYRVMNELKLKLRELSREEREEMILRIYKELKGEMEERFERFEERFEREEVHEERHGEREQAVEEVFEKLEGKEEGREHEEHEE